MAEDHKIRSIRLQHVRDELKVLKSPALEERDAIVKTIEDEAEKRIKHIIKKKEDLKKQVGNEFSFVEEVVTCLDTIPDLVERLDETVADAETFLAEPARHIARLEKIITLRDSMITYGQLADQVNDENIWKKYESHCQTHFDLATSAKFSMFTISTGTTHDIMKCSLVHEHVLDVDDDADCIPCVTIVGSKYTVAHPTSVDKPSSAFDVYAFPGTYERTITEHVSPLYGMTRTPEDKVAILSDGTTPEDSYCVRIFDTEAGYVRSSSDIKLRGQVAFDVNMRGQYVILSKEEEYMVTVARDDGTVVLQHTLDNEEHGLKDPSRIAAVGSYYYIMAGNGVAVYQHRIGKMSYVTKKIAQMTRLHDISGSRGDVVTVILLHKELHCVGFGRTSLGGSNKLCEFSCSPTGQTSGNWPKVTDNRTCHLSVSSNHIVASSRHTVRVYSEKY